MKILSFGGGRQTVAIACMIVHGDLEKPDHFIFADPQDENPITYIYNSFVEKKIEEVGVKYHTVTEGNIIKNSLSSNRFASMPFFTLNNDGTVGMLRRQCTNEYKIAPVEKKYRELLGLKPRARHKGKEEMWIGYSINEIKRVDKFLKRKRPKWIIPRFPLIEKNISLDGCIEYLLAHKWLIPPKSSCNICPYQSNRSWWEKKKYQPKLFQYILFSISF